MLRSRQQQLKILRSHQQTSPRSLHNSKERRARKLLRLPVLLDHHLDHHHHIHASQMAPSTQGLVEAVGEVPNPLCLFQADVVSRTSVARVGAAVVDEAGDLESHSLEHKVVI